VTQEANGVGAARRRAASVLTLRIAVSLAAFGVLLHWAQPHRVIATFRQTDKVCLALALLTNLVAVAPAVLRWHLFVRLLGMQVSFRRLLALYLVAIFFNNFLPTSFGGDVVRAYGLARDSGAAVSATSTVLADRLSGMLALVVVTLTAAGMGGNALGRGPVVAAALLAACLILGVVAVLLSQRALEQSAEYVERRRLTRLAGWLRESGVVVACYRRDPRIALAAMAVSLVTQALLIVTAWLLCLAVDQRVSLRTVALYLPAITFMTMLPVSFNGVGVQDAGFVLLFGRAGTPAAAAISMSLLWHAARLLISLFGLPLWITGSLAGVRAPKLEGGEAPCKS